MTDTKISISVMFTLCLTFSILLSPSVPKVKASLGLSSIDELTEDFKERVEKIVTDAVNNSKSAINSTSSVLSNGSNLSSSQIVISNNGNVSASQGEGLLVLNQIRNENGACSATKIGGSANDTLSSEGVCNDQLTGGLGADKFTCGQGNDTIRDFSPDEGDTIVDRQSCEKVL